MGTSPTSLAAEAAVAAGMAVAANEATARTEAAAAESDKAAAREAKEQELAALAQLKVSLTEAHRFFELKFVAHKGAEVMHESSSAVTAKVAMVDEAQSCTILDECEYATFDPDGLPSVPVALQERNDAQDALRKVLGAYEAGLKTTGTPDDDTGKFVRAPSPSISSTRRARQRNQRRGSPEPTTATTPVTATRDATTTTTATMSEGTTAATAAAPLNSSPPPLLPVEIKSRRHDFFPEHIDPLP